MLTIGLFGEIEVARSGERLALPPSRKTRALLAYLVATGRVHRRERLCSLFWEIPDDPRGALRWSLSRLRSIVNDEGRDCIVSNRETVSFDAAHAEIDLFVVRQQARDIAALATDALAAVAGRFRGEFLEGIDLPDLHDFQAWLLAEREDARRLQAAILTELGRRLDGEPESALPYLRQLVAIDPYNGPARATLVRHLAVLGRRAEAERHFEAGMRVLAEGGDGSESVLRRAWRDLQNGNGTKAGDAGGDPPAVPGADSAAGPAAGADPQGRIVGREQELARLTALLSEAVATRTPRMALLTAAPGLGKTRIAEEVVRLGRARGYTTHFARAHEIQQGRAFALWRGLAGELAAPPADGEADAADDARERMFRAVADRILGTAGSGQPVLIVFDDMQWCDEGSAELLHVLVRAAADRPLVVVLTARLGELGDNPFVPALLRALRHDRTVAEITLAPLASADAEALVCAVAPDADAAGIAAECGGNPLFAVELARGNAAGGDGLPGTLKDMIRDRIDRLPEAAGEAIRWASLLGPSVAVDSLAVLTGTDPAEVLDALETLERHALVREDRDSGGTAFLFAHDLIRRAIHSGLSEPRRRLMHLRIARALLADGEGITRHAEEIARHAVHGGDAGLAASAFIEAGRRCLRLYANAEAAAFAGRAMRHAEALPEPDRVKRTVEAMQIRLQAEGPAHIDGLAGLLEDLAERALDHDCHEHAAIAFHLLSLLRWERGFPRDAERDTIRAELVSRTADGPQRVTAMAETARCLAMLERDLDQAEALVLEAAALGRRHDAEPNAIADARGLLCFHRGETEAAAVAFHRARFLARRDGERANEYLALEHLAELELARGDFAALANIAEEMERLAGKLPPGSDAPFAATLLALGRLALGMDRNSVRLDLALADLVAADAKRRLSLCLRTAAELDLAAGRTEQARKRAEEALRFALALDRPSEAVLCRTLLVRATDKAADREGFDAALAALRLAGSRPVSAHARRAVDSLAGGRNVLPVRRPGSVLAAA